MARKTLANLVKFGAVAVLGMCALVGINDLSEGQANLGKYLPCGVVAFAVGYGAKRYVERDNGN